MSLMSQADRRTLYLLSLITGLRGTPKDLRWGLAEVVSGLLEETDTGSMRLASPICRAMLQVNFWPCLCMLLLQSLAGPQQWHMPLIPWLSGLGNDISGPASSNDLECLLSCVLAVQAAAQCCCLALGLAYLSFTAFLKPSLRCYTLQQQMCTWTAQRNLYFDFKACEQCVT